MTVNAANRQKPSELSLGILPTPAKALISCIIVMLSIGMTGALGQIIVHDIIPTFFTDPKDHDTALNKGSNEVLEPDVTPSSASRGDLFTDLAVENKKASRPFYTQEQFVWILKWTHIHLFGMSMIFIILGGITIWLDVASTVRTWLVVLPFAGILVDILAMWLKGFVSPFFFWLHLPGGALFTTVFCYVSLRAVWEMWIRKDPSQSKISKGRTA